MTPDDLKEVTLLIDLADKCRVRPHLASLGERAEKRLLELAKAAAEENAKEREKEEKAKAEEAAKAAAAEEAEDKAASEPSKPTLPPPRPAPSAADRRV